MYCGHYQYNGDEHYGHAEKQHSGRVTSFYVCLASRGGRLPAGETKLARGYRRSPLRRRNGERPLQWLDRLLYSQALPFGRLDLLITCSRLTKIDVVSLVHSLLKSTVVSTERRSTI